MSAILARLKAGIVVRGRTPDFSYFLVDSSDFIIRAYDVESPEAPIVLFCGCRPVPTPHQSFAWSYALHPLQKGEDLFLLLTMRAVLD